MGKKDHPMTPGVRFLEQKGIAYRPHQYIYLEKGGAPHAAAELGIPESVVIKTLVFETDERNPLLVLMHGDREVSTKQMARLLHVKHVSPASPAAAQRYTGYMVGGISPFGTRTTLPVYVESSILALDRMFVNGGKRGFLVEIHPRDLARVLEYTEVNVGIME
jgi:Cys-tRNA(Pro) deacylase